MGLFSGRSQNGHTPNFWPRSLSPNETEAANTSRISAVNRIKRTLKPVFIVCRVLRVSACRLPLLCRNFGLR